ncbi:MAG: class I SAM-dependent methyltransferase, partial [Desulfomonilaceae bacterium]
MISHFDAEADKYDLWFESDRGHKIFALERGCLKRLFQGGADGWLEVGVGSGRFGASFGITNGVDPSLGMLKIASHRGVRAFCGVAEDLPFRSNVFDGILMVTTICFVANPQRTFSECYRTLQPSGKLVLGIVPKNSSWGRLYEKKGRERHPLYS